MVNWRIWKLASAFLAVVMVLAWTLPEEADAGRMGGGSSFGSRGSRSFSTPKAPPAREAMGSHQTGTPGMAAPATSGGFGRGLLGGIGGFMLGGILGSLLFGGAFSGTGLLDILLMAGLAYMAWRFFKSRRAPAPQYEVQADKGGTLTARKSAEDFFAKDTPVSGGTYAASPAGNEVDAGLARLQAADRNFTEAAFLTGARIAFTELQNSWVEWKPEALRPLMTERLFAMVEEQATSSRNRGERSVVDKIVFETVEVSEVWQEAGLNYLTVRFVVSMVEATLDRYGKVLEGDPNRPSRVEEYWTFTQEIGSRDPNWQLSAIQQAEQVAKAAW
ncbi:MAG: Tim44/TimA family putative adaptor protein [Magnetococcales bacterium]|nr:Tim44/TimA family putative adaptor protein [Magnetococcales bacterium]